VTTGSPPSASQPTGATAGVSATATASLNSAERAGKGLFFAITLTLLAALFLT